MGGPALTNPATMPTIFLAHGAPPLIDDAEWVAQLDAWARAMPRPTAILMISAHWEERPLTIGATTPVPLIYDFYGFPERYYRLTYPSPGAPDLARRVRALLEPAIPVAEDPARGLDHGAFIPLLAMYPAADVPVLQVSLPTMDAPTLFEIGRRLTPLRDEGVLIVGSGFLSHNLRAARFAPGAAVPSWAQEFDLWAADALERRDVDQVVGYEQRAPGVDIALPTREHFVPVIVTIGSSVDRDDGTAFPVTGWLGGSLTKRSVQFG